MATFNELATELSRAFESRRRDNGNEFRALKDGSPEWMNDVCREAHGNDFLPDDFRYRFIEAAADHFAENDADDTDELHGAVDSTVDVYNGRLTAWLASSLIRIGYCDDAAAELGANEGSIVRAIQLGQYAEIEETFGMVAAALTERASDDATPFKVEGVETDDGSRTTLAEFDNSGEARAFLNRYTSTENAGNWNLIEVYDTRGDDAERLFFWERAE